jgi:uncharacterized membrane protein
MAKNGSPGGSHQHQEVNLELALQQFTERFAQGKISTKEVGSEQEAKTSRVWQNAELGAKPACQQANPCQSSKNDFGAWSNHAANNIAMIMAMTAAIVVMICVVWGLHKCLQKRCALAALAAKAM